MITTEQARGIINYLYAARAIKVTRHQDEVWANYINGEIPDLNPRDCDPASRRAIKTWSEQGRTWEIDVARWVRAAQEVREARLRPYGTNIELPPGIPANKGNTYIEAFKQAVRGGATENEAKRYGLQQADFTPKPAKLVGPPPTLEKFINKIKGTQE